MITSISANQSTFHDCRFEPGLNVVLAVRTSSSTEKDSRNGVGKSTLIDIIHLGLASEPKSGDKIRDEALNDWEFTVVLHLRNKPVVVRRSINSLNRIYVTGDTSDWPMQPRTDKASSERFLSRDEWARTLGWGMFDLAVGSPQKYSPTYRSLISYFVRKGHGAFLSPFLHNPKQMEWDKQVNSAYLLNLNWEHASRAQELRDREKELEALRGAVKSNVGAEFFGTVGSLESARVRLDRELQREREELRTFRVHPQYKQIEDEANSLTFRIRDLTNGNVSDSRMLELYEQSLVEEQPAEETHIVELMSEAGVILSDSVVKTLDEVRMFHQELVGNRQSFLEGEIGRLRQNIAEREIEIERTSNRRAELLMLLDTYGALEEYNVLSQLHATRESDVRDLDRRIDLMKRLERERSAAKIDRERLRLDIRADLEDRRPLWEEAIELFNANSEALYDDPGELAIDLKEREPGFQFDVRIDRSGSHGIERMKIFCYDLMLAQLWATRAASPQLLVHDSEIFDGVDERQVARAIELAARESTRLGFQYICCLNSDAVPDKEFSDDFDFDSFVRVRLRDDSVEGRLLGIRF